MNLSQALFTVVSAVELAPSSLCGRQLEGLKLARLRSWLSVGLRVRRTGGAVEPAGGCVVIWLALGETDDQGGHGHLNVEFDHVDDRVELNVYDLVLEEHETDQESLVALAYSTMGRVILPTYVHANWDYHQLRIEAYERLVLGKTDLFNKSNLHDAQEVPIETSVDDENENLRDLIPYFVDVDEDLASGRDGVRRDPDAENGDVDGSDENDGTPLDVTDCVSMFGDKCNSVDDDLHEQLDFEDPEEKDEKQDRDTMSHC